MKKSILNFKSLYIFSRVKRYYIQGSEFTSLILAYDCVYLEGSDKQYIVLEKF